MTQTPDDHAPATRKRLSIFNPSTPLWLFPSLTVILCALIIWIPTRPRTAADLSKKQLARDASARARAGAFVQALGFEPAPAVCRALRSGSAWCTVRVANRDQTFSLWCSWRHPTCIENLAKE